MNKIDVKVDEILREGRLGLMTHVIVGYPTVESTIEIVKAMEEEGVDMVELQIPFSDPLADGPTIMKACEEALAQGVKVSNAFTVARALKSQVSIPLIFMAYYNTVLQYGVEKFCKQASLSGISGVIVPDMPLEEEGEEHFFESCKKHNLYNIRVISPVTTDVRLRLNSKYAQGFVYCSSRQGTTGAKDTLNSTLVTYLNRVHKYFSCPIAVGFGISKKQHLMSLKGHADIAVIGSAVIDVIARDHKKSVVNVRKFLREVMI